MESNGVDPRTPRTNASPFFRGRRSSGVSSLSEDGLVSLLPPPRNRGVEIPDFRVLVPRFCLLSLGEGVGLYVPPPELWILPLLRRRISVKTSRTTVNEKISRHQSPFLLRIKGLGSRLLWVDCKTVDEVSQEFTSTSTQRTHCRRDEIRRGEDK